MVGGWVGGVRPLCPPPRGQSRPSALSSYELCAIRPSRRDRGDSDSSSFTVREEHSRRCDYSPIPSPSLRWTADLLSAFSRSSSSLLHCSASDLPSSSSDRPDVRSEVSAALTTAVENSRSDLDTPWHSRLRLLSFVSSLHVSAHSSLPVLRVWCSVRVVVLLSESGEGSGQWDAQRLLDSSLLSHPRVAHIECRPITALNLSKALHTAIESTAPSHTHPFTPAPPPYPPTLTPTSPRRSPPPLSRRPIALTGGEADRRCFPSLSSPPTVL